MPELFGKSYTPCDILRRVGDMSQVAGATSFTYSDGKSRGTRAIEVRNGSGLRFIILTDKGMNIANAEIDGIPFSYISKTGVVSPVHYDEPDFLRSFEAGLLTTCGLTYMGAPCVDNGESLGAHGRISNTPAFDVCVEQGFDADGDYVIDVSGKVREACVFGANMLLKRHIVVKTGENVIYLHDEIVNEGFEPAPLMVLYHMNFGFPLIDKDTVLTTNCVGLRARDADALPGIDESEIFSAPIHGYREQVFYRDSVRDAFAALSNPSIGLSVRLDFSSSQLPYLVEWKQMGEGEYVVGLEPATYPPDGRAAARTRGELDLLQPSERKEIDIKITASHISTTVNKIMV